MAEPDYKAMYFHAMRELEKVLSILIALQLDCEEMYLQAGGDAKT